MQRTGTRLLLAFLVARLALAAITAADPTGGVLTDSKGYLGLATALVQDGRYATRPDGEPDLLRPPMYAGFLAVIQVVLGTEAPRITTAISLLQLAMSGLTAWLLVLLGRRLGREDVGLAAGWLYALSPNVALWSLTVMTEVSFALLLTLASLVVVWLMQRSSPSWPVVAGILLGALAYLRPIALTLLPLWGAIAYWSLRRARRQAMGAAAKLLLAGVLVVLPWVYRNWATYEVFAFSTATAKTWIGFNLAEVVAQGEGLTRNQAVATLDPGDGLIPLTLRVLGRYPVTFIKAQAIGVLRTLLGSDIGTWGNVLNDDTWIGLGLLSGAFWGSVGQTVGGARAGGEPAIWIRVLLIAAAMVHSLLLIGLAVIGTWLDPPNDRAGAFTFVLATATVLLLLIVPGAAGQARFRIPAEPFLAFLAGGGVVWIGDRMRQRGRGRQLAAGSEDASMAASG